MEIEVKGRLVTLLTPNNLDLFQRRAIKTKNILAKPVEQVIEESILDKIQYKTLEGMIDAKAGTMVCIGAENDVWHQKKSALFGKYTITDVSAKGWLTCTPKPDNEVSVAEIPPLYKDVVIVGLWGEKIQTSVGQMCLQFAEGGDFFVQSLIDPDDRWIVKRRLFISTYEFNDKVIAFSRRPPSIEEVPYSPEDQMRIGG